MRTQLDELNTKQIIMLEDLGFSQEYDTETSITWMVNPSIPMDSEEEESIYEKLEMME